MTKPDFILKMEQELETYYQAHPDERPIAEEPNNQYKQKPIEIEKWNDNLKDDILRLKQNDKKFKKHFKAKGYKKSRYHKLVKKLKIFSGTEPEAHYYDNLKYKGSDVMSFMFKDKKFTKEEIRLITNQMSEYLEEKGISGKITSSLFYDAMSWRSSQFSDIGSDVELFDPSYNGTIQTKEQLNFNKFVLYLIIDNKIEVEQNEEEDIEPQPQAIMGADYRNNNCLYNCLDYILMSRNPWKTPNDLKRFCNVGASAKIPLNFIPKIEKEIKGFAINISGDYQYQSKVISNKQINLILKDEHITINYIINNKRTKSRKEDKTLLLYDRIFKFCYDGIQERLLLDQERYKIMNDYNSPYILVNRGFVSNKKIEAGLQQSLKDEYDIMIEEFNKIKIASKGQINFYRTGTIIDTAKTFFNKCSLFLVEPQELTDLEHKWIKYSSLGALAGCIKENQGTLYKYDINSLYPSIMKSTNKLPIKQGEFKIMTSEDFNNLKYFTFGIYRARVEQSKDENINRLYRFTKYNHYTHISLEQARELGLRIELIEDGDYNFLWYSRDKLITFNEVFSQYVDYLYDLKQKKISPYIKMILNILWGSFCEINKKKIYLSTDTESKTISKDYEIVEMRPCVSNDDMLLIKTVKTTNIYKYRMARISPFILAISRKTMSDIFLKYKDNIKYIRTDGVLLDININDKIKTGLGLGELRYEGYYPECKINNLNSIDGEFIEYNY